MSWDHDFNVLCTPARLSLIVVDVFAGPQFLAWLVIVNFWFCRIMEKMILKLLMMSKLLTKFARRGVCPLVVTVGRYFLMIFVVARAGDTYEKILPNNLYDLLSTYIGMI